MRADILAVATAEFAERGLEAASVNEIAAKTATTKRMIYYYFTSKEGLYTAVLERSYRQMAETLLREVGPADLEPVAALRRLAERTFDHHDTHREYVRLVVGENMLRGAYIRRSGELRKLWAPMLDIVADILRRGREEGTIRDDVDPIDVQVLINSFSLFRITNQYTFDALYDYALDGPEARAHFRGMIGDVVTRAFAVAR
ncbi:TetR/AcrR family transcriptional regulator [Streptomyces endocoffeicus]|uniref:TetR/AcrR family transcriptional regulator n=1 Tax=Streptomyces endocoffeicus TaxID=2898945 RepID=UPI0027DDFDC0|nr:TetR/AcrR family transcriptional regulator [Streptomyces endocoffeicus]